MGQWHMASWRMGQKMLKSLWSVFSGHPFAAAKCVNGPCFSCKCGSRLCSTLVDVDNDFETKDMKRRLNAEHKQRIKDRYYKELNDYRNRKPPTPEEKLIENIEKAKRKVAWARRMLQPLLLSGDGPADHDPEILTSEQLHYLRKIGRKNQNYVPVGKRGVYGGTIQNMHLNWKKHETVRLDCHMFPLEQVKDMAEELARLSGGIVIEIIEDKKLVILYRGKNYEQPEDIIPKNTLDKRKALKKALYEQSMYAVLRNITRLEEQLRVLRQKMRHDDVVTNSCTQLEKIAHDDKESSVDRDSSSHRNKDGEYFSMSSESSDDWDDDTDEDKLDAHHSD